MTTITLASLQPIAGNGIAGTVGNGDLGRISSFEAAMARQQQPSEPAIVVAQTGTPAPVSATGTAASSDANGPVQGKVNLETPGLAGKSSHGGDLILEGMRSLRTTFDGQYARVNRLTAEPVANTTTILEMQMEVARFSVLVDLTSKLTGKVTQSFDTLMKGQ